MKQTIGFPEFLHAFDQYDRQDSYSYEGKKALFEWFEQYEEDCDQEIELDVISICCDFSEYGSAVECVTDCGYDFSYDEDLDEDENEEAAVEYLNDNTFVVQFDGGIIIQGF